MWGWGQEAPPYPTLSPAILLLGPLVGGAKGRIDPMDLDDIIAEVLEEYEVSLGRRDLKDLIALCLDELENEGEVSETILQQFFSDLEIEPASGMISEIIYRVHEKAEETIDDLWNLEDAGEPEEG